ncbi:uncharacterized protein [Primulina eburnea]|uniref:uncharacterized protein n=1 Tax=Primulina eburnea TaxID=1245227 RepID=UPI003C6C785C
MASTGSQELAFTYSQQGVPIFVGQDYELWSVLMKTLFVSHELWDIVEEGFASLTTEEVGALTNAQKKEHKENKTKDAKALSFMHQGVSRAILPRITCASIAKDAWQILKNQFGGHEKVITIKVSSAVNQIKGYGDNLEEKKIIEKVLRCLPAKFEHIVAAIEESKDLSKLTLDELMGSLEAHEKRMSRFSNQSWEQTFQGKVNISQKEDDTLQQKKKEPIQRPSRGRGRGRYLSFQARGHRGGRSSSNSRNSSQNQDSYCRICRKNGHDTNSYWSKCKKCRNTNHSQRDCWYQDGGESREANFTEEIKKNETDQVFYSCLNSQQQLENIWYVDSGCSNHMSGNKNMFVDLDESYSSELLKKNYKVEFNNDLCIIIDKQKKFTVASIKMTPNKSLSSQFANSSESCVEEYLKRGSQSLAFEIRKAHVKDVSLAKMHRLPFPKISYRAKVPLELVHADVCEPMQTPSINNYRYFLLFVDDYTRMMWVYILKEKSEAFPKFIEFKTLVENQNGKKIKILRTDRGGEFNGKTFMDFCKEKGIQRQLTVRYSPQQNGVAERKNRTIVEMARSMMAGKGLPKSFWAEAINTTFYFLNRSPTKALPNKTPYEAWYRRKPQVQHLKVFGCIAYYHIPSQQREKFDKKGEKLIFIGYSDESKGFRFINPKTNKLIISRDVIFNEEQSWSRGDDQKMKTTLEYPIEPLSTTHLSGFIKLSAIRKQANGDGKSYVNLLLYVDKTQKQNQLQIEQSQLIKNCNPSSCFSSNLKQRRR